MPWQGLYGARLWLDARIGGIDRSAQALAREADWSGAKPGAPTVLCLDRAMFRKDIKELQARSGLSIVRISAARVKEFQEPWVSPDLRKQTYFNATLNLDRPALRRHLSAFAEALLEALGRRQRIDAVLAANADYWQDEAMKVACRRRGIPFLVLGRENYVWAASADRVKQRYIDSRFNFGGKGVAVASQITLDTMATSGCFPDTDFAITGWPRFDSWHDPDNDAAAHRDTVLLISYAEERYLAPKNFAETLAAFALASSASGATCRFVVKAKKANEVQLHYDICPALSASRCEVVGDEDLPSLLRRARVVVGFNSLAVLEALLSGAAVIVPWWSDTVRGPNELLLDGNNPTDQAIVHFPESSAALQTAIGHAVAAGGEPGRSIAKRIARFAHYTHFDPNETASRKVEAFIRRNIAAA